MRKNVLVAFSLVAAVIATSTAYACTGDYCEVACMKTCIICAVIGDSWGAKVTVCAHTCYECGRSYTKYEYLGSCGDCPILPVRGSGPAGFQFDS